MKRGAAGTQRHLSSILSSLLRAVLLAACAAVVVACAAPSGPGSAPSSGQSRRGGIARIALWQEPARLIPYLGTQAVGGLVLRTMFDGLLLTLPDGSRAPQLAAEVPSFENGGISADGLTITWKLRRGALWSDGEPLTSRDVAFTYAVIMDPANPVANRSGYPDIESVSTPDETTVVVKYRTLYSAFKGHFPWVLPEHFFGGDTAIETKQLNHVPIGSGPFVFKSWTPGEAITLERNPNYRERGKPYIDSLIFKIVPSREVGILWLKAGEIEVLWNLVESNVPEIEAMPGATLDVDLRSGNRTENLTLNTSCPSGQQQGDPACPHPVLGDLRVRQAVELAIDKQAIIDELLLGKASLAPSVIAGGPYAVTLPPSEYDPARARQLLEEAGWNPSEDGVRVRNGLRASLRYSTTTGDSLREQTQVLIQAQLRAVGIELRIENLPSSVLLGGWVNNSPLARGNFDIGMATTTGAADPQAGLFNFFHSSQIPSERTRSGGNSHRILDPELDRALEAAGSTLDEVVRKSAYQTVAERVAAGKGRIPLYSRSDLDAFKINLKGHAPNVWTGLMWNAEDWWIEG